MTSQSRIPRRGAWLAIAVAMAGSAAIAHAAADHLLISEVLVKERPGVTAYGSEYIEITNAGDAPADLAQVYLSDASNSLSASSYYYNLVTGGGAGGGGTSGDFHARFPAGAALAPGASVVVALRGSTAFQTSHGRLPDYELFEDGVAPDGVPELVEAFPGSIGFGLGNGSANTVPTSGWLDDVSETLVMYSWDGAGDLVADLDYLTWGTTTSLRINKTGVTVDGPDTDGVASAYLADTAVGSQHPLLTMHGYGKCFQRLGVDEGAETATGGNGLTGHDETSENLPATWSVTADQDPTSTGAAAVAAPVITAAETTPATPYNTLPVTVAATVLPPAGNATSSATLHWRTNAGWTETAATAAGNVWSAQIPALPAGTVVQWYVTAAGTAGGAGSLPHGAPFYVRTYTVQQVPDPGDSPPHLLLTEVCVQGSDHEFIEIYNPTDETVELDNYYVTDAVYNTQGYWLLPAGNPSSGTIGGGTFTDFQARFPAGATIEPGEALTLSLAGSDKFQTVWGVSPDFEIREDGASQDAIPNMREVFPGSLQGDETGAWATLTNTAEIVVLYYWNGSSNLVTDIDMFMWGSSTSARVDKTGVSVNGSTYAADTPVASQDQFMLAHEILGSFQRLDPGEGTETEAGGNGPLGHDETSENLSGTWSAADGTPGVYEVVELAVTSATIAPQHPQPGEAAVVTAAVTGTAAVSGVTLRYSLDGGAFTDVACTDNGNGTWSGTIPAQAEGVMVAWYVTAAGAGGATAAWPEGGAAEAPTYTVETIVPGYGLAKLLLTKVCTLGTAAEFVEICNPNAFDVPLRNYYLTDAVYYESQAYWNLPAGTPTRATVGGGDFTDFTAKFPDDAVLAAGDTITVSIGGSQNFLSAWGVMPYYELFEDDDYEDAVDDLQEVFPGSIDGVTAPTLSNLSDTGTYVNGEMVALFFWDGVSDLVTDIDVFIWGEGNSYTVVKTGITIGASTYAAEAGYPETFMTEHANGEAYVRVDATEGGQVQSGGNGFEGADETSENLATTWAVQAVTPVAPPLPEGSGEITLGVPAKTFLASRGETFRITFTASPGAETVLRILDLNGRLVRHLYDSRFDGDASIVPDTPSIRVWDGRNETYELARAGMYVVHLQVTDPRTGKRIEKTAPAVVSTRLSN